MLSSRLLHLLLLVPFAAAAQAPCSEESRATGWTAPEVTTADGSSISLDDLVETIATRRVAFVGELHNRFDHHLNQLEVICRLRGRGPMAIGLEFFQTPFQDALDAYVFEHGDLQRLLAESEWFTRWRFDPRLYAPILRYARRHRIALVALNMPSEIVSEVAKGGMESLDAERRSRVPASIFEGPPAYKRRLREVFDHHPGAGERRFDHFLAAQLLWDEGMAQRAADFLLENPAHRLVVLAGEGHIAFRDPIPARLARRVNVPHVLVLQSHEHAPGPEASDFVLDSEHRTLPAPGRLGVHIDDGVEGVSIVGFGETSAGRDAGLKEGDRIVSLDGAPVKRFEDVRLALWRKVPGDPVTVAVRRGDATREVAVQMR